MAAKRKPEPRRVRLTVPAVDESVLAWLDLQDDASASMRMLVRESIARDGYVDVINKPVDQLPRRGRPPQGESDEQSRRFVEPVEPGRAQQLAGLDDAEPTPAGIALEPDEQSAPSAREEPTELASVSPAPKERSAPPAGLKDMLGI